MSKVARFLAATTLAFSSLFLAAPAQAAVMMTQVTCESRTHNVGWDNRNQFFAGKGNIAEYFCRSVHNEDYLGDTLSDPAQRYFNGVIPAPVSPEPAPVSDSVRDEPASDSVRDVSDSVREPATDTVRPPELSPEPTPQPSPAPTPSPEPTIQPAPQPEPTPAPEPAPEPKPEPALEPKPLPAETPAPLPSSKPEVPASPPLATASSPKQEIVPAPKPEPPALADKAPSPKPIELPSEPKPSDPPPIAQLNPKTIEPEKLTQVEVKQLTEAAVSTLAMSEPGSAQYEQALDQLAVVAEADDEELPTELANIPLLGGVASAVLDSFNDLGNIGADMSPKQREEAKKQVLVSMAVSQAVMSASMVSSVSYRRGV